MEQAPQTDGGGGLLSFGVMEDVAVGDLDLMEELFMAAPGFDFSDFSQPGAGGAASPGPCFSPLFDICSTTTTATPPPLPAADDDGDQAAAAPPPRRGWVFQPRPEVQATVKERLRRALERIASLSQTQSGELLAQVWVPTVIGDRQVLTTCGQPFWLDCRNERLANYRTVSMKYQFSADETARTDLGMPGRVFVGRVPEWTPDVRYFSTEEYPRVRHAQYFDIRGSVALPIFEPRSRACLGVVELVMTTEKVNYNAEIQNICSALKEVDLRSSDVSSDPRAKVTDTSYGAIIPEIVDVLRTVCETHKLPLAQTWIPCIYQAKRGSRHTDEKLKLCVSTLDEACYVRDLNVKGFHEACSEHHLFRGEGVVGRAFVTNEPCFSEDITTSSKIQYPLSHHAKLFSLRAAVAIRLRSISTGRLDYVLEFFLPVDCMDIEEQRAMLNSLSITIQQTCYTLRVVRFTMNTTQGSGSSSQQDSQSLPLQTEFVNDSEPIQVDDDEPEDNDFGTKRKLNSVVWKEFKKVKICGNVKAQCLHCHKQLGGKSTNGTSHLHGHLKICSQRKIKLSHQKRTLEQSALRFNYKGAKLSVENYTFDPEVARKELAAIIVPHEYPLSIVYHAGSESTPSLEPEDSQATNNARFAETVTARMKATGKRPSPAASSQEQNVGAVLAKEVEGSEKGSEINHSPDDSPSKKQCLDVSDGVMDLEAALHQAAKAKSSIENIIKIYKDGIGDDFTKLFRQSEPKRVNRFKDRSSIVVPKSQNPWIHMVLGYMRHDFEEIKGLIAVPVLDKSALVTAITRSLERWGMLLQDRAIPQEASELIEELKDLQRNLSADSERAVPINVSTLRSDEKHIQDQLKIGNNSHKSAQLCLSTLEEYGAAWDKILQYVKNKKLQHLSKIKELESTLRLARSELSKEQGHEATIVNSQAQYNEIKCEASEAVSHFAELLAYGNTCLESIQASIQEAGSQGHSNLSAELCLQLKFIESCQVEKAD